MFSSKQICHKADLRVGTFLFWRKAERLGTGFNHFFSLEIGNKMDKFTDQKKKKKKLKWHNILISPREKLHPI